MVAPDKKQLEKDLESSGEELCPRGLVVHSLRKIEDKRDGFHSEDYITPPPGYFATRVF
jgi:hypothetical protein